MKNKRLRRWLRGSCAWMLICVFGFMSIGVAEGLAPADTGNAAMSESADAPIEAPAQDSDAPGSDEPVNAPAQESGDEHAASSPADAAQMPEQAADEAADAQPSCEPTPEPTAQIPTLGELRTYINELSRREREIAIVCEDEQGNAIAGAPDRMEMGDIAKNAPDIEGYRFSDALVRERKVEFACMQGDTLYFLRKDREQLEFHENYRIKSEPIRLIYEADNAALLAAETTAEPDAEPTEVPTVEPTVEVTAEPTVEPTVEVTAEPTVEVTAEPTAEPTVEVTVEPTVEPTVEVTSEPTAEPTVEVTAEPTAEPTVEVTAEPTAEPTVEPSVEPDATPSVEPSATPSVEPSATPSVDPSATPSVEPDATPSVEPSATPMASPSPAPTEEVITVPFLERAMGLSAPGNAGVAANTVPVTGKDKLDGTPVSATGIPSSINMGWVSRLSITKDIKTADGRTYSFCGAAVEGSPCVFTGEYEGVVYYSTDGYSAVELGDKKVELLYWEYFTVTMRNPWFDQRGGEVKAQDARVDNGKLTYTEKTVGSNKLSYMDVRSYAGEKFNWSATPGADENGVRYILSKIIVDRDAQNPTLPSYKEQYGASYSWDITANKDIDVRFEVRKTYQVRFTDTTFMLGTPNPDGQEFNAGVGSVRLCGFHADQGFYTVSDQHIKSMTMNGHALNIPDDSKINSIHREETATTTVDGYTVTIRVSYVSSLASPDAEYKYTIDVRKTGGIYEDLVFAPVFEQMQKSQLELCLYVNGQRRGDGVDIYLWNGSEASAQSDGDRYEMKSNFTTTRETKLFFFNVKPGYILDGNPWAENAHNNDYEFYFETPDQIPEYWRMTGVYLSKWNNLEPLKAKQAAKEAGYQYSLRIAGDDTTDGRDQYKIHVKVKACDMYVKYEDNSGDPAVAGVPSGYFGAYEVDKGGHTMQAAPTRKGYDFTGWKLKAVNAGDTLYQPGQNFPITGANFADATLQTIDGKNDCWVYTFEATWEKAKKMHRVEHYLPRADGSYSDVPDVAHDCLTPNGNTTVFIIPIDGETDSRFKYYEPDYEYSKVHGQISSPTTDAAPFTGTLKLFYKKIKTAYMDFTWTEHKGTDAYEDWFDREGEGYIWSRDERIGPFKIGEGSILPDPPEPPSKDMEFLGWRLTNDTSGKLYQPRDEKFIISEANWQYAIHHTYEQPVGVIIPDEYVFEFYPVWKVTRNGYVDYVKTESYGTNAYEDWFDRPSHNYIWPDKQPEGPYDIGASVTMPDPPQPNTPGATFIGWRLSRDPSGTLYKPGEAFVLTEENWKYTIHHEYMMGTGIIIPDQDKYEFYPVWQMPKKAYVDYVKTESQGTDAYEDWFNRWNYGYIWTDKNPDGPYAIGDSVIMPEPPQPDTPGSVFNGWRLSNDPSGTLYKPGDKFIVSEENWPYTIHHEYMQPTGIIVPPQDKYEFYPVWDIPTADLTICNTVTGYSCDTNLEFEFRFSAINPAGTASLIGQTFKVSGVEGMTELKFEYGYVQFYLKHGDKMVIHDLPVGWTYTISEVAKKDYDTSVILNGQPTSAKPEYGTTIQRVVLQSTGDTVEFINKSTLEPPPTGVHFNDGAWLTLLIMAAFMSLMMYFTHRKHQHQ